MFSAQYEELFRQIESRFQSEPVTGLLLLYPKNCVHIIEVCGVFEYLDSWVVLFVAKIIVLTQFLVT